jgi:hypothetical protein
MAAPPCANKILHAHDHDGWLAAPVDDEALVVAGEEIHDLAELGPGDVGVEPLLTSWRVGSRTARYRRIGWWWLRLARGCLGGARSQGRTGFTPARCQSSLAPIKLCCSRRVFSCRAVVFRQNGTAGIADVGAALLLITSTDRHRLVGSLLGNGAARRCPLAAVHHHYDSADRQR